MGDIAINLTDVNLGTGPTTFLLHLAPLSTTFYIRSLLIYLLNAAKVCIPLYRSAFSYVRLRKLPVWKKL